jgi:hypothetical protein
VAAQRHLQQRLNDPRRDFYHGDKHISNSESVGKLLSVSEYLVPKLDIPTIEVLTERRYVPSVEEIENMILSSEKSQ